MRRGDKGDICRVIRNRVEANLLGGSSPTGLLPESRASSKTRGSWVLENRDGIPRIPFKRFFLSPTFFFISFPIVWKKGFVDDIRIGFDEFLKLNSEAWI